MAHTLVAKSESSVLDLRSALTRLRDTTPGQFALSIYLDTSPERITRQAYLLTYRDGIRSIRATLAKEDLGAFKAAATRAEQYLTEEFAPHARGLALFVHAGLQNVIAVRLPKPPILEHVAWQANPEIGPLEAILDDNERIAVVLFDTQRARLLTVFLGVIEEEQELEDYVPGRQATGGWFGLQQTNFERHREDHLRRHVQRTVHTLLNVLRTRPFDRLLLAGPEEPLAVLRRELPRPLRARLTGTLDLELFAPDAEVLDATLAAADAIERKHEQELVDELIDAASTPHVVLGIPGTVRALAEGRVHLLLVPETYPEREVVVRQAIAQGARIESVSGAAAAHLNEHGGLGAWTRF